MYVMSIQEFSLSSSKTLCMWIESEEKNVSHHYHCYTHNNEVCDTSDCGSNLKQKLYRGLWYTFQRNARKHMQHTYSF